MIRLTAWERIENVICWAGLNSYSFATHIGLRTPQSLYQIKAGKHGISRALAEKICSHYPEVSFAWLISGEGEMFYNTKSIPYYTDTCEEVALGVGSLLPTGYTSAPKCGDCDFAAPLGGRQMEPRIAVGSLLYCRACGVSELESGDIVLVVYGSRSVVRFVSQLTPTHLTLTTPDSNPLTTLAIERTLIRKVWIVKAIMEWPTH